MNKTDFDVKIDWSDLQEKLNRMSASLKTEKMNKICMLVMKDLLKDEMVSLRKTISSQGYSDIMKGYWGNKGKAVKPSGIYLDYGKDGYGVVMSIAEKNADFRLKWFEHGTEERLTKDSRNRGSITGTNWFSDTIDEQAESISGEIVSLIKKEIEK